MKNHKTKILLLSLILFITSFISAQQIITLENSIKLALLNNYGLEIARSEQEISKINNDLGSAGFLPQIKATAGNNLTNYNIHQETNTGIITDSKNVSGNNVNASIGLSWTLFDGTKMFATHKKLNELEKLSEIKYKMAIEDLVYRVITQYYTLIKLKQQILLSESLIELYKKRKLVAETKNTAGSSSGLEVLQAQADFNAQNATLLKLQSQFQQAKYSFARIIINNPQEVFDVNDSLNIAPLYNLEAIKTNIKQNNIQLKAAKINLNISEFSFKEARAGYFPKIGFGANYNFASTDNSAGSILNSRTDGPYYGFTATWNLFDGMAVKRSVKSSKIQQKIMQLTINEINLQLETAILSQFKLYESNLQITTMEEQNITIAKTALDIAMEKYTLGIINDIQLKEVQRTFEDAQLRLITARYDTKISETELLRLQGLLIR